MWSAIRTSWPLFFGMIFLMVSNGLLATLLTLRAAGLGFSDSVIGLVQSAYPIGSLLRVEEVPTREGRRALSVSAVSGFVPV